MAKIITKEFKPDIRPVFRIEISAYTKMLMYVSFCESELAWHGFVTRGAGRKAHVFTLHDVFLFPQKANYTYCKIEEDYYNWYEKNIAQDTERAEQCRFFGHKHPGCNVNPSDGDKAYYAYQVRDFAEYSDEYYIFIIMNQADKFDLQIFDYKNMVWYGTKDIDSKIVKDSNNAVQFTADDMRKEIKDNVFYGAYRYSCYG